MAFACCRDEAKAGFLTEFILSDQPKLPLIESKFSFLPRPAASSAFFRKIRHSPSGEPGISGKYMPCSQSALTRWQDTDGQPSCAAKKQEPPLRTASVQRAMEKASYTFTRQSESPCPIQTPFWRNHPRQYVPESHPCSSCPPESSAARAHHGEPSRPGHRPQGIRSFGR